MRYLLTTVLAVMLAQCTWGQNEYKMAGPYEIVARDGQYRNTKAGSERDMKAALDFAKVGKYDEAKNIIDKYAATLQRLDGHDAPLCLIQCYDMVYAMILSDPSINTKNPSPKPLDKGTRDAWEAMIRRAIVPTLTQFENDSPYANGNWGAIVNRCRIACAIFLKDDEMYEKARYYYLYADDCVIFCKSPRAAERVCESIAKFIERKLFLKVNREKTHVGSVHGQKFLGYSFNM